MDLRKIGSKIERVRINGYTGAKVYTLMNKDIPLIRIDEDADTIHTYYENREFLPYYFKGTEPNFKEFIKWASKRTLILDRKNSKKLLNACGLPQDDKFEIAKSCKFLSVEDCFWIKENDNERWENVNLRTNPLSSALSQIALEGSDITISGDIETAEFTLSGFSPKAWIREEGGLFLHKKSGDDYESEKEDLASNILDILDIPHITYNMVKKGVCKCQCMTNEDISRLTFKEYSVYCNNNGENALDIFNNEFNEYFCRMAIADYILANTDRHAGNWGFFVNNKTGEIIEPHPLFDHNLSFDQSFSNNTKYIPYPEATNYELAIEAIKEYPLKVKDLLDIPKESFMDLDIDYDKFTNRVADILPKSYGLNANIYDSRENNAKALQV